MPVRNRYVIPSMIVCVVTKTVARLPSEDGINGSIIAPLGIDKTGLLHDRVTVSGHAA